MEDRRRGVGQGVLGWWRSRREGCLRRWRRRGRSCRPEDEGHLFLRRVVVEATTLEDLFPPERKEELEGRPIDGARDLNPGIGRGDAADNGGNGRPVGRERRELLDARVLDLLSLERPTWKPGRHGSS